MAETLIFPEQSLTFEADGGMSIWGAEPAPFTLAVGETYRVILDGTEWKLVCEYMEGIPALTNFEMNESGDEVTDGSFFILYGSPELVGNDGGAVEIALAGSTGTAEHTLAIYQITPVILLADHTGEVVEHSRPDRLRVDTGDGATTHYVHERLVPELLEDIAVEPDFSGGDQSFAVPDGYAVKSGTIQKPEQLLPENIREGVNIAGVHGAVSVPELIEGMSIELDFSGGDQSLAAPDGTAVKTATITKPETLIPGNIREGVTVAGIEGTASVPEQVEKTITLDFSGGGMTVAPEEGQVFSEVNIPVPTNLIPTNIAEGVAIAGIIGTLMAGSGGGSGSLKIASGDFTATATSAVITHNLGVVPDIAGVFVKNAITGTNKIIYCYNFCAALYESYALNGFVLTTSVGASAAIGNALDGTDPYGMGILAKANETTMRVGSSDMMTLYSSKNYHWFAIGGLT